MKQLKDFTVKKGTTEGRVRLKLETADGMFQAWLDPEQAERLAADLFRCRFDLPPVIIVDEIPKWRTPPDTVYISFRTTMPRELGLRPSGQVIKEIKDPALRKEYEAKYLPLIEAAQVKWDKKKLAKRIAKKRSHGDGDLLTGVTRPKKEPGAR